MHVIIPCKNLDTGKSRLADCLDGPARRAMCERLLAHTLDEAARAIPAQRIDLVTSDDNALAIAEHYGISGIADSGGGLNAALDQARAELLRAADMSGITILPIDLPLLTARALTKALDADADVVIAPDDSGTGTNLLILRGPALRSLPFAFGAGSSAAHLAAAQARGLTTAVVKDRRIAFDIDNPAQYSEWLAASEGRGG